MADKAPAAVPDTNENTSPKPEADKAPAAAPKPAAKKAEPVTFYAEALTLTVWDTKEDKAAAQFEGGEFTTADKHVIAILDATDGVERE